MDFKSKTCKKIAELTQVINILFIQNHEKDLIINQLRDCFDNYQDEMVKEIQLLKNSPITINEEDKRVIIKEISEQFFEEERRIKQFYDESMKYLQEELQKSYSNFTKLERQLQNNNSKYDKLLTDKATKESLLQDEIMLHKQEINGMNEKYKTLDFSHQTFVKKVLNSDLEHKHKIENLKSENVKLNNVISKLKEEGFNMENKCKEMEMELGSISKQLLNQKVALQRSETAASIHPKTTVFVESQMNEELRKELIRYKLELSNRDGNFTKLFNRDGLRIQQPFNHRKLSHSDHKNRFNTVIGISQKTINNATVKIVSAQYENRKTLPNITKS